MKNILVLVFVFLAPSIAVEQSTENIKDGNHLLRRCKEAAVAVERASWKDSHEAFDAGFCHGIIEGVVYTSNASCVPDDGTADQMARVVIKFLQDNPEKLNLNDAVLVELALSKAFPCQHK